MDRRDTGRRGSCAAMEELVCAEASREEIAKKTVVLRLPGMDEAEVKRDVVYRRDEAGDLTLDLYRPPGAGNARLPAVVFVSGYPDEGMKKTFGCRFKEMGAYVSWARLVAASGMAAIVATNREPVGDGQALLAYLAEHGAALGLDERRIGIWACSGNGPTALSLLMGGGSLRCAVLCYPMTLDFEGSTGIADAARAFGFANPCAGRRVDELPGEVPLFVVRAGRDEMPGLNGALDRFVSEAVRGNLLLTFVNHPEGPHAFDLFQDGEASREIIRGVLRFLVDRLAA